MKTCKKLYSTRTLIFGSWPGSSETARQGLHTVRAEIYQSALSIRLKYTVPSNYTQLLTYLTQQLSSAALVKCPAYSEVGCTVISQWTFHHVYCNCLLWIFSKNNEGKIENTVRALVIRTSLLSKSSGISYNTTKSDMCWKLSAFIYNCGYPYKSPGSSHVQINSLRLHYFIFKDTTCCSNTASKTGFAA